MKASIVITTYNRAAAVARAIQSVLIQPGFRSPHEIVIVDDASTDDTVSELAWEYSREINAGIMRIIANERNVGVTGSKNAGFDASLGDWVFFLDSDDTLSDNVWGAMLAVLQSAESRPIVFFRCKDQEGSVVGTRLETELLLDIKTYIRHTSYGEALTAINKGLVEKAPYISALRGYEGLGCCRLIEKYGPAVLSTVVARRYDQSANDRLSVSHGFLRRMHLLARGHWMLVQEFGADMRLAQRLAYLLKAAVYFVVGGIYHLGRRKHS